VGDQQVSDVVLVRLLAGGGEVLVGSHGGRAGLHHLGCRGLLAGADPVGSRHPGHGALPVMTTQRSRPWERACSRGQPV
jgi:hypothetical protein